MRFERLMSGLALGLFLAMGLAGCAPSISVRPPTATELDKVKAHQLAVVLFRLRANIDGKPAFAINPGDSNNSFRIYLASLDDLEAPKQIRPSSFSEGSAVEGWHYLTLPPGVYYLLVLPPGVEQNPPAVAYAARSARYGRLTQYRFEPGRGGFWSPELMAFVLAGTPPADFREMQGFWFQVPDKKQIVYLGSLATECRNGRGLGGLIDSCNDYEFSNDPESAKQAVASSLPGLTLDALPLVPYGKPRGGKRLRELVAMNVVARAPVPVGAAFTGPEMDPWGVVHGAGRGIAVYNLLAIGLEFGARASAEKRAEDRVVEVQACVDRLSKAVGAIDYSARFASALERAARELGFALDLRQAAGTARSEGARYRLTTSLPILRLREVAGPQSLALELAVELRLEAGDDQSVGYYSMLSSAPELSMQNPLVPRSSLYARFIPQRAKPRPIAKWCGVDGAALLAEDNSAALIQIAAQFARDLD